VLEDIYQLLMLLSLLFLQPIWACFNRKRGTSMKKFLLAAALLTSVFAINGKAHAEDINPNLAKLKAIQEQMRAQGIEMGLPMMQEMPSEGYQGADKQKILDMAIAEWKENYPEDEVLGARIHMDDWERTSEKRWNTTGDEYLVDYSELQVLVFVKKDNMKATAWPLNVTKDHQNGGKLEVDATGAKATDLLSQDIFLRNVQF
jgi:hypothetical protein